jgi:transcriptional regulator GlxA family with amidase domain
MAAQDAAFETLLARILGHLADPLELATLASWAQCSPRALQVLFRQRLGCTPIQWLRRERLQQAHRLLEGARPGDSVAAIARRCGYRAAAHFSEDFRRQFGRTPSQVRGVQSEAHPG